MLRINRCFHSTAKGLGKMTKEAIEKHQKELMSRNLPKKKSLPNVAKIILVSSGKGGVGKSTTAVNLTAALSNIDFKVAVLDADIHGPSIPHLMNLHNIQPELDPDSNRMMPLINYDIQCMSMGFLIKDKDKAAVWRGPMVMGAIQKLMFGTKWSENTDCLVIDMPPGTGDIHLSIAQNLQIDGAVVVSTPQELALADARKGMTMFNQVSIPILGLIENMSTLICSHCQTPNDLFGTGGVQKLGSDWNVPYLGNLPLDPCIMTCAETGIPLPISKPDSHVSKVYGKIAQYLASKLFG